MATGNDTSTFTRISHVHTLRAFRPATVPCSHCHGSGAEGSEGVKTCDTCKGSGVVTRIANTILGQMQTQTTCPTCGGEGKIVVKKCTECNGEGVVRDDEIITINIPAG